MARGDSTRLCLWGAQKVDLPFHRVQPDRSTEAPAGQLLTRTIQMTPETTTPAVNLHSVEAERRLTPRAVSLPEYDREGFEDVAFMTAMGLVLLGNYSQTGHFGGPLAYTPYNVAIHLGGPAMGGMRYDLREPKHPFADRFMLTGGHSIPTCYSLWMVLYEAMKRQHEATGDERFRCDPEVGMYGIDTCIYYHPPINPVKFRQDQIQNGRLIAIFVCSN